MSRTYYPPAPASDLGSHHTSRLLNPSRPREIALRDAANDGSVEGAVSRAGAAASIRRALFRTISSSSETPPRVEPSSPTTVSAGRALPPGAENASHTRSPLIPREVRSYHQADQQVSILARSGTAVAPLYGPLSRRAAMSMSVALLLEYLKAVDRVQLGELVGKHAHHHEVVVSACEKYVIAQAAFLDESEPSLELK